LSGDGKYAQPFVGGDDQVSVLQPLMAPFEVFYTFIFYLTVPLVQRGEYMPE
jgi:hypothetical protein